MLERGPKEFWFILRLRETWVCELNGKQQTFHKKIQMPTSWWRLSKVRACAESVCQCWVCVHIKEEGKGGEKSCKMLELTQLHHQHIFKSHRDVLFSEVLNPWLDLCVSVYKSSPLLLQLSRPSMWNVSISWFGRCQWDCSEGFDWWRKILHRDKPCCDLFLTRRVPHTKIHLRPHLCMCVFFINVCVRACALPHTVDTYISCWVRCSFSSLIFWKPTLECSSSSLSTVDTHTHRFEFTWHNEDAVKAYKSLPAYNTSSKTGLSPEAVTLYDL